MVHETKVSMKILSAAFVRSCTDAAQLPRDRLPEVACAGRSNVGKSSLINSLLNRKGLAKVSGTPGKTRSLNFFRVSAFERRSKDFYLVDLPGYGYAHAPKSVRTQWGAVIEQYVMKRSELRGILLLVDARGIGNHDEAALSWLRLSGTRLVIVVTKFDKVGRSVRTAELQSVRRRLGLVDERLIPYSSATGEGRNQLWGAIQDLLFDHDQ
jgi:GTP-binding protein